MINYISIRSWIITDRNRLIIFSSEFLPLISLFSVYDLDVFTAEMMISNAQNVRYHIILAINNLTEKY